MNLKRPLLAACGIAALAGLASSAALATDVEGSLQVGEKAPMFELEDQNGAKRSLAEMLKEGKVALVFYRSASW